MEQETTIKNAWARVVLANSRECIKKLLERMAFIHNQIANEPAINKPAHDPIWQHG